MFCLHRKRFYFSRGFFFFFLKIKLGWNRWVVRSEGFHLRTIFPFHGFNQLFILENSCSAMSTTCFQLLSNRLFLLALSHFTKNFQFSVKKIPIKMVTWNTSDDGIFSHILSSRNYAWIKKLKELNSFFFFYFTENYEVTKVFFLKSYKFLYSNT